MSDAEVTQSSHGPIPGGALGRPPRSHEGALYDQARVVAANAYAPYSGFCVGAVLAAWSGRFHLGVNVENASYPAGLCAERAALAAAVTAGERRFTAIAVATADGRDAVPCGVCLQALSEFGEFDVVVRHAGEIRVAPLSALLTAPFASPPAP
jgi:cytidine deaminase